MNEYQKAAELILNASHCVAFTGAGISVESGIPPFRGENGLWNKYDPSTFDIQYFMENTAGSWAALREIFYELFGRVLPNAAHYALAELEAMDLVKAVITQNVDNLHKDAGSNTVYEFHGSLKEILCLDCSKKVPVSDVDLNILPPACVSCGGTLKPGVVFFGEPIPEYAATRSFEAAEKTDCMILIGTTGTVAPANMIPSRAKASNASIIEINPLPSEYTRGVTDIFLQDKATAAMEKLMDEIDLQKTT
ncbi:MAG: NAD-dependent deacylase [Desulfobacterales bacterium]|nr:NAD-dependent deacylase [Desulfobacterales bacterium]